MCGIKNVKGNVGTLDSQRNSMRGNLEEVEVFLDNCNR